MSSPEHSSIDPAQFARHARAGAAMTLVGAIIVVGSLVYSGRQLTLLQRERENRQAELASLQEQVETLTATREKLKAERAALLQSFNEAQADSLGGAVKPEVRVRRTSNPVRPHSFTISLEGDRVALQKIKFVRYDLSTSPRIVDIKTSSSVESKFSVSTGPQVGCLNEVRIEAYISETRSETFFVDLCDALETAVEAQTR